MSGNSWECLSYPIIIDSGASESVLPTGWCDHAETMATAASQKGVYYTAANGHKIYNKREKHLSMMSREGVQRKMRFQVCDVERPLGSVSSICSTGHSVVFNPPDDPRGSYIEHSKSGERMYLEAKDGVYVLNTKIAPKSKQARPFGGQGR